jgi:staphylococcal nuclease domain-containing protein 1
VSATSIVTNNALGTSALEQLMSAFRTFHLSPTNNKGLEGPPKVGEYVAAKFTEDNTFYRARVRHVNREAKEADVLYIDYGNSEKIPFSRLRPLIQPQFQISKLRAQAVDAVFSFLQFPTQPDYASESVEMINHLTAGRQLVANVDWTSPEGILHVTLYDPNSSDRMEASLNSEIVSEGLAMVPFKLRPYERAYPEMIKALKEKETTAKAERRGMWEYGDITED